MLRRRFDQVIEPAAQALVAGIRCHRGDDAAILAAELLAEGRTTGLIPAADA